MFKTGLTASSLSFPAHIGAISTRIQVVNFWGDFNAIVTDEILKSDEPQLPIKAYYCVSPQVSRSVQNCPKKHSLYLTLTEIVLVLKWVGTCVVLFSAPPVSCLQ